MSKILKNTTASPVVIADLGVTVPANGQVTIDPTAYNVYAASSSVVTLIGNGTLKVNDGSADLTVAAGINQVEGNFPTDASTATNQSATNASLATLNNNLTKLPIYGAACAPVSPGVNVLLVSVVIAPANAARKSFYIYNNSANSAYITFGPTSTSATCTALVATFTSFVMSGPVCYTGAISAIRNSGSGVCTVHELT